MKKYLVVFLLFGVIIIVPLFAGISREEIKAYINKFAEASNEIELEKYAVDIAFRVGIKALPLLLEGLKSENVNIKCGSYIASDEIISKDIRKPLRISVHQELDFSLVPEDIRPIVQEMYGIALKDAVESSNTDIRKNAVYLLGLFGGDKAVEVLKQALKDADLHVRYFAFSRLSMLGHKEYDEFEIMTNKRPQTPKEYAEFLSDTEWGLYIKSMDKLREYGREAIPALIDIVRKGKEPARQRAIQLLGEIKAEEAIPIIEEVLRIGTEDETMLNTHGSCIYALESIATDQAVAILVNCGLKHTNPKVRLVAAKELITKAPVLVIPVLEDLGNNNPTEIKFEAAWTLIENKRKEGIPILINLLNDKEQFGIAKSLLEYATGQKFGGVPPIVSDKIKKEYIMKWKDWWEKNKDTFKFPDP